MVADLWRKVQASIAILRQFAPMLIFQPSSQNQVEQFWQRAFKRDTALIVQTGGRTFFGD
jgi:hypothetical protein